MKQFWNFKAAAPKKAELYLYGEIGDASIWGDEVTPAAFQRDLAALGQIEQLDVFINSPGGSVFAGFTIYNILKRNEANITVHVDGIAASAASIVAMSGDRIIMPQNSTMMVHEAWGVGVGNKASLRELADMLDRVDGQLAGIYAARTGKDIDVISKWMQEEHWMSGDEALADGFCDEVEPNKAIAACLTPEFFAKYKHPPEALHPARAEPEQTPTAETGGILLPAVDDDTKPYIPAKAESAVNGAATQPVADRSPETAPAGAPDNLAEQRKRLRALKMKLLEV